MTLKFYGLKTCDTCRKAQKELTAAGVDFDVTDVRADGVAPATLAQWVEVHGWQKVLNTRSTSWRGLGDDEKNDIDAAKAVDLMVNHPTLIKRPVIEKDGQIFIGGMAAVKAALA